MKTNEVQKLVHSYFKSKESPSKIFRDLKDILSRAIAFKCSNMIRKTGNIKTSHLPSCSRIFSTKKMIQKVNGHLICKKSIFMRKLSRELKVFKSFVQRILKNDVGLRPYKQRIKPKLT